MPMRNHVIRDDLHAGQIVFVYDLLLVLNETKLLRMVLIIAWLFGQK